VHADLGAVTVTATATSGPLPAGGVAGPTALLRCQLAHAATLQIRYTFEKAILSSGAPMSAEHSLEAGATFSPSPVMRPVDQVRVSIVQAIATGQLRPGDRLPSEVDQARGFRVSRASVREALRSLVEMGLLTTVRGRGGGSFVNRVDSAPVARNLGEAMDVLLHLDAINVAELLEARRVLEGTCAALGARRRSAHDLDAMEDLLARARDASLSDAAWLEIDIAFHRAVAGCARNRVLVVPLFALHAIVQPRLNEEILPLLRREEINDEHAAIHTAIRDRDSVAVAAAVDRHLDRLERLYQRAGVR
jgi:GntR family transcriptional regulator, transcriptional repressor for pyruvate dehydrogenase complex